MTVLAEHKNLSTPITLAMTGASGAVYGLRLLECLLQAQRRVYFLISDAARTVAKMEMGLELPAEVSALEQFLNAHCRAEPGLLTVYSNMDWLAPPASGTGGKIPMVVCPASGGTIAAIASGISANLIQRAADVAIKEKRPLIFVPREMPASALHLENQLKLAQLGATIMPASPGFYQNPQSIDDLVDFVVARILDQLDIAHTLLPRWGSHH
ncbi:MAG: UbiX family flavin prenyltransferase [Pseudomonadales bacterium]|nr:UbiX family flavin prenyltransferase [Pseudomonadales bacterium]